MKHYLLLAALAVAAPLHLNAKPAVPTIEQLAAFPDISSLSVSPDGTQIAGPVSYTHLTLPTIYSV